MTSPSRPLWLAIGAIVCVFLGFVAMVAHDAAQPGILWGALMMLLGALWLTCEGSLE